MYILFLVNVIPTGNVDESKINKMCLCEGVYIVQMRLNKSLKKSFKYNVISKGQEANL